MRTYVDEPGERYIRSCKLSGRWGSGWGRSRDHWSTKGSNPQGPTARKRWAIYKFHWCLYDFDDRTSDLGLAFSAPEPVMRPSQTRSSVDKALSFCSRPRLSLKRHAKGQPHNILDPGVTWLLKSSQFGCLECCWGHCLFSLGLAISEGCRS